jgi:hypothetical protein
VAPPILRKESATHAPINYLLQKDTNTLRGVADIKELLLNLDFPLSVLYPFEEKIVFSNSRRRKKLNFEYYNGFFKIIKFFLTFRGFSQIIEVEKVTIIV